MEQDAGGEERNEALRNNGQGSDMIHRQDPVLASCWIDVGLAGRLCASVGLEARQQGQPSYPAMGRG
jgi:hypothetical protein